ENLVVTHFEVRVLDMRMSATNWALAKDWPAGRILSNLDERRWHLDLGKLLGLGRMLQRRDRRLAAGDRLRDRVEIPGTDEALVLYRTVAVAVFAGEFLLLHTRVSSHARIF